jgi:hypothetical protein
VRNEHHVVGAFQRALDRVRVLLKAGVEVLRWQLRRNDLVPTVLEWPDQALQHQAPCQAP